MKLHVASPRSQLLVEGTKDVVVVPWQGAVAMAAAAGDAAPGVDSCLSVITEGKTEFVESLKCLAQTGLH